MWCDPWTVIWGLLSLTHNLGQVYRSVLQAIVSGTRGAISNPTYASFTSVK